METRLKQFHLEGASEKTLLIEFGKFAQSKASSRGKGAAAFYILGFTHYPNVHEEAFITPENENSRGAESSHSICRMQ